MPRKSSKKCSKKLAVGDVVSFYNVKDKCKVRKSIKGFVTRSNKKGRTIKFAYAKDNGTKVMRIVSNVKAKKKSSKKSSKKCSKKRSSRH